MIAKADLNPEGKNPEGHLTLIRQPKSAHVLLAGSTLAGAIVGHQGLRDRQNPSVINGGGAAIVGAGLGAIFGWATAAWLFKPTIYVSPAEAVTSVSVALEFK